MCMGPVLLVIRYRACSNSAAGRQARVARKVDQAATGITTNLGGQPGDEGPLPWRADEDNVIVKLIRRRSINSANRFTGQRRSIIRSDALG